MNNHRDHLTYLLGKSEVHLTTLPFQMKLTQNKNYLFLGAIHVAWNMQANIFRVWMKELHFLPLASIYGSTQALDIA